MPSRNYPALAIGACLAITLMFSIVWKINYITTSEVVTGEVLRLNFGGHHPEIEFETRKGQTYRRPLGSWWSVQPGQAVQIRYVQVDPPGSASINTLADMWIGIVFLAILTAGFIVGGIRGLPFKGDARQ